MNQMMEAGPSTLFGQGWRCVVDFEDVEDIDEYESEEEEIYVTIDLGDSLDSKFIAQSGDYQLIGLDTPTPFLRVGTQIFQGQVEEMMGSEVIYGQVRDAMNPHNVHHPARHIVDHRLGFQPVNLVKKADTSNGTPEDEREDDADLTNKTGKAAPTLHLAKRGRPKGSKNKPKPGAAASGSGSALHDGEAGGQGAGLTDADFFMREAERELINSAKERGEEPIKRTRKSAKGKGKGNSKLNEVVDDDEATEA